MLSDHRCAARPVRGNCTSMRTCTARLSIRRPHTASRTYGRGPAAPGEPALDRQWAPRSGSIRQQDTHGGNLAVDRAQCQGRRIPTWRTQVSHRRTGSGLFRRWLRPDRSRRCGRDRTRPTLPPALLIRGSDRDPLKSAGASTDPERYSNRHNRPHQATCRSSHRSVPISRGSNPHRHKRHRQTVPPNLSAN